MFWEIDGKPVLLLGGSKEDNLFQIPDLEEHLDTLAACGGNYIRCTLSSRDPGDVWPFEQDSATGLYNLERPSAEYWRRIEQILELTAERGIVLQFELWDRFDFAREPWEANPFNPKNNQNYTAEESGLPEAIESHPGKNENRFFYTVPELDNNTVVLPHQERHIDRLLEVTLPYRHALFCMDNETSGHPKWGAFWARYLRSKAEAANRTLNCTEMWDNWDITDADHEQTWRHPELYTFCDVSQNNHHPPPLHWRRLMAFRNKILDSATLRPINCVKVYGSDAGGHGRSEAEALARFTQCVFGGCAAVRFHRPHSGIGLSESAQTWIRSLRDLSDQLGWFDSEPIFEQLFPAHKEAQVVGYGKLPEKAAVAFITPELAHLASGLPPSSPVAVHWLDLAHHRWEAEQTLEVDKASRLALDPPSSDTTWVALLRKG